uniref:Uncharacterized protein n=1 Tax=Knipowitschia caucasica TaxID=637954 RepID=A0AAV2L7L8_KNICA
MGHWLHLVSPLPLDTRPAGCTIKPDCRSGRTLGRGLCQSQLPGQRWCWVRAVHEAGPGLCSSHNAPLCSASSYLCLAYSADSQGPGWDALDGTPWMGRSGWDALDGTLWMGRPRWDALDGTLWIGRPGWDALDETPWMRRPGWDALDGTPWMGRSG